MDYKLPKLPYREENSNKGTFGKVLNIAGSKFMPGAAYLSSVSALKIGAGYVELVSDESVLNSVSAKSAEIVLAPIEKLTELIADATVIEIGCGLSTEKQDLFKKVLEKRTVQPMVIDADGLNILAKINYTFDKNVILTPHPKEAARLLNCTTENILNNPEQSATEISKKFNCITVLKTHQTKVTSPDGRIYTNSTGNSALAKAGSGDILCGMIAGLLAQKMEAFDAAALGVYLHGKAGELASEDLSEYSVLASDLLNYIPKAIKNFTQNN